MSDILFLASDYIERMSNPVYGISMNEDYALKLATLLRREGFEATLTEEIRSLTDPNTLTSYGWLWLFGWARARNIALKEDLLVALYEEWSSEFVRAAIVDLATRGVSYNPVRNDNVSVDGFPNRFLARIMKQATSRPEAGPTLHPEEESAPETEPSTERAESTLIALLQVGSEITTEAAKALLRHNWPGRDQLRESFWEIYHPLDPQTQEVWLKRLDLTEPEGHRM